MAYLKALVRAMRPLTVRLSAAGVVVGGLLAGALNFELLLAMIITMLLVMFGNLLNDWFDWEIDRRKGKDHRPLSRRDLLTWSIGLLLVISVTTICLSSGAEKLIVMTNLGILVLYNTKLGAPTGLFGNVQIAYLSSSTLVLGALATGNPNPAVILLASVVFLVILAREIVKDIEDVGADVGFRRTLPMRIGIARSGFLANILLGLAAGEITYYIVTPWSFPKLLNLIPAFLFLQAFHAPVAENTGVQRFKWLAYAGLITGILTVLASKWAGAA